MQKRRLFGLVLIALGLVVFFMKPIVSVTGFAVADQISGVGNLWFYFIGSLMIVGGLIGIWEPRRAYTFSALEDIINTVNLTEDKHVILDSSFVVDARENKVDIDRLIGEWGENIIIPREIYNELSGNRRIAEKLKPYVKDLSGKDFRKYKEISRKILEQGDKHQTAIELLPYLENPRLLNTKTRREQAQIANKIKKVGGQVLTEMQKSGANPRELREYTNPQTYIDATANYLKKHWLVSKGDVDVLGYAIYDSRHHNKADILSSDRDFKDALDLLKRRNKQTVAKNIRYLDFRRYAAA